MPYRILPGVRELEFGIDGIDIGDFVRRGQIEFGSQQPFIEKPDATRVEPDRRLLHKLRNLLPHGEEKPLQDGELYCFVLERKSQISLKGRGRRMTRRVDAPSSHSRARAAGCLRFCNSRTRRFLPKARPAFADSLRLAEGRAYARTGGDERPRV